jgi:hypothetical protein
MDILSMLKGPDTRNWQARKRQPTQFGDNKTTPSTLYVPNQEKELTPEELKAFVDKHAISILSKTEEGREFLAAREQNNEPATPS